MEPSSNEQSAMNLDCLIRRLATTHADKALLSYPEHEVDYMDYTGADIERLTRLFAAQYSKILRGTDKAEVNGCSPNVTGKFGGFDCSKIIALLGVSTIEYYLTFLALQRLGYTTMFLSPRLAEPGYAHLLRKTGCHTVVAAGPSLQVAERVRREQMGQDEKVDVITMLERSEPKLDLSNVDISSIPNDVISGIIIHTGGTTGLPKPVPLMVTKWLAEPNLGPYSPPAMDTLCTLPLFHSFGMGTFLRGLRHGTRICLLNPTRPVTASLIRKALDVTGVSVLASVPYVLKFLVELEGGVERLAQLDNVASGGSATPDELGDLLIKNGVRLHCMYGQTESGILMMPVGTGLGEWNWLSPLPQTEKYLWFEHVVDNMYHLVVLPGLESKVLSDRPDGSYGTKDLFCPHPDNLPGNDTRARQARWKFVARHDDIIVLVNGENADPSPLETALKLNPNVQMAVAFGAGQERLGILVIPSERAAGMSRDELVQFLLPDLEKGNALVADYARVGPEDLVVKPVDTEFPLTDKSTLQRAVFNRTFAADIEAHYANSAVNGSGKEVADEEVQEVVRRAVEQEFATSGLVDEKERLGHDTDFFATGMDSLQSSRVRMRLMREISLGGGSGRRLATNVVFEYPSIKQLTQHILEVRHGKLGERERRDAESAAREMVRKYGNFTSPTKNEKIANGPGEVVVLTGATGYIGVQVLYNLIQRSAVSRVYCLVRTPRSNDHQGATKRIDHALANSKLLSALTQDTKSKIVSLSSKLSAPDLGLSGDEYEKIRRTVTAVIHNAWSVNFNMSLESFEPNVASTFHLLNLCLSSPAKNAAKFIFISSIAAVTGAQGRVEERLYDWAAAKPSGGYGQSKWVAEQICAEASQQAGRQIPVKVLRVGQVSGDIKHGIWNPAEAIPATVQSALTIGALPKMMDDGSDANYWLPSDTCACVVTELTFPLKETESPLGFYHVASPHPLSWNNEVLPALKRSGVLGDFQILPAPEWVKRLEEGDKDVSRNPPYKLVEHFKRRYGRAGDQKDLVNKADRLEGLQLIQSLKYSPILKNAPRVDGVLIGRYAKCWTEHWTGKDAVDGQGRRDSAVAV